MNENQVHLKMKPLPAGFLLKVKWAGARLIFFFFLALGLLTGGIICWFFAPLYSWYFFGEFNFTKYIRFIYPIMLEWIKVEIRYIKHKKYRNHFPVSLTAPPMMFPEKTHLRISQTWMGPKDNCNGCIRCCVLAECPLIDMQRKTCLSYGTFFWRYFHCGRYPENQEQIDFYQCPKWSFKVFL